MEKYKIVVSDLHLGRGRVLPDGSVNIHEDFVADRVFAEFLDHYSSGKYFEAEVELILCGDILNLIQVDYRGYFSPILTESISAEKMQGVVKGHPIFFDALKKFAATPRKRITYIVGNHDVEMIWDTCKDSFTQIVGAPVQFRNYSYISDGVHYEHGQQYEAVNRLNPKKVFLTKGLKEPIINLPWGAYFVINFVVPLKNERPHMDKVRPISSFIKWSFINDTWWSIRTATRAVFYFIGTRFSKSKYRQSNLMTTLKILRELPKPPTGVNAAKRILEYSPEIHTVVMGHTHRARYVQFNDGREYLNSGTWTEVTSLDLSTLGKGVRYNYVFVDYGKNPLRPHAYLREWKGRWHEDIDVING